MRIISLLSLLLLFPIHSSFSQCDVFIEPGSVNVIDNGSGVMFEFDVTNSSSGDWYGDVLKMYWSLNSGAPIWNIDYSTNTNQPPIAPGETRTLETPWFDIPNLPSWFPEDPGPGGTLDDNWVEAYEWPYWSVTPDGFDGTWSQVNLRLGSCGLADGAWVYNSDGTQYYGPFNSDCPDLNGDAFCDCDLDFIGFDPVTLDVSVEVISDWNCGTTLNAGMSSEMSSINHIHFGIHVPGWDYPWGCTTGINHPGWSFAGWSSLGIESSELHAGDIFNANLLDIGGSGDCFQEILSSDTLTACPEIVIWQINYSKTLNVSDGGWAVNPSIGNSTQEYPDISIGLNSLSACDTPPPLYPGCMDPEATNYDPTAGYDDNTCAYGPVLGCTDPVACNYNSSANSNDGSCDYSCIGCTDESASNYNPEAVYDNNSCEYLFPDADPSVNFNQVICNGEDPENSYNIFVYNYGEDTLFYYCIEIPELEFDECYNGYEMGNLWIEPGAGQFMGTFNVPSNLSQFTVIVYDADGEPVGDGGNNVQVINISPILVNPCLPLIDLGIDTLTSQLGGCNGQPIYWIPQVNVINYGEEDITEFCTTFDILNDGIPMDTICLDGLSLSPGDTLVVEFPQNNYGADLPVTVTTNIIHINGENPPSTAGYDQVYDNNYSVNNFQMWCYDCTDPEANNYNEYATDDDGSCTYDLLELIYVDLYPINGCDLTEGGYYIPEILFENTGNVEITEFCSTYDIYGSTYEEEFCWTGTLNPGDLIYIQFPPVFEDGLGAAYIQVNGINGQISFTETITGVNYASYSDDECIYGCTIVEACNYDPLATVNDGSCDFETCVGCTDPLATNYNPDAWFDDGSCEYDILGCTDPAALNYDPLATLDDGSCQYVIYLGGCTDPEAINYNVAATYDDGSCIYDPCSGILGAVYYAPNTFTPNNDGVNDGWTIVTDPQCWLKWHVQIYNRWGQLIWESFTPGEVWPGSQFDGGYYVADGVYFYQVIGIGYNPANTFRTSGNITVFR